MMRRAPPVFAMAAHLALFMAIAGCGSAEPPEVTSYTIEQLMASDDFGSLSFSPDNETLLFTSTRTGLANIYTMPVEGGEPRQLTHSTTETIGAIGFFPDDERVLYSSDQGGNELHHLYVRELDGSVHDVTPGDRLKARFSGWANDGQSFYAVTNERDPRYFDLYEYGVDGYERRLMFENDGGYQIRAVSPDRRRVALSRIHDNANTDAFLYDTNDGTRRKLTPEDGDIASTPEDFSHDGRFLFYTTDEGHEFQHLMRLELATDERTAVLKPEWDVYSGYLTHDGRWLVVTVNEDARTLVHLFDPETLEPLTAIEAGQGGTIESFAVADGAPMAALIQGNGDMPGDVYIVNLESGEKRPLLRSLSPEVAREDLVAGKVVRFESYDGTVVPGILYTPKGAAQGDARPAAIWVHGGPGSQSRIGYDPLIQYLVNDGYVVYEINNRGSSGYGKTFYHMDDHRHGDADLDDVVASKRMLVETGYVDPQRIAIMGGSYGGYMTLAGLTFRPTEFAAGVNLYGVSNWVRLLQNTPPWWTDLNRLLKSEMGDWEEDKDYLRRISPLFSADRIVKPLLVLQGENDPRVLPIESEDIVAAVRANGVPVEYISFPDEGHGFRKKANRIVAYRAIKSFLDKHLKGVVEEPAAAGR